MTTAPGAPARDAPTMRVAVIGGGPAGLMAAEALCRGGAQVSVFDAMPSVGRKFLLAGKGGLNLTHGEGFDAFCGRFGTARPVLGPMLQAFGPPQLRAWAGGLGVSTFVGSSGRVFPTDLKAAPLLRAWLHRLRGSGVAFHMRHRWLGWSAGRGPDDAAAHANAHAHAALTTQAQAQPQPQPQTQTQTLRFATPGGELEFEADAVLLALGGASWSRLGSDGAWVPVLAARGVDVAPLRPSNCGFDVARVAANAAARPGWSEHFRTRFAGQPLKNVALSLPAPVQAPSAAPPAASPTGLTTPAPDAEAPAFERIGEFLVTDTGIEGSLVYALSALAREQIAAAGHAIVTIDLLPGRSAEFVRAEVARPRGARSLSTHLKSRLGLDGVKAALLHELLPREAIADTQRLAAAIKALPLRLVAPRPIDEAISSAGGVRWGAFDAALMLRNLPGVFCAGEMLDWEAPTGGYLLTASCASAVAAAEGALRWLAEAEGGASQRHPPTP